MSVTTIQLRRLVKCMDAHRVPLNSTERSEMPGDIPYWGANGIVGHVDRPLFSGEFVLLGEDGAPFDDPTRNIAFHVQEPIWVNNHMHVLAPADDVDARFLTYALNSMDWMPFVTGSTRLKLTQDDMLCARVPIWAINRQRAISNHLDTETARIDGLIAKKRRMIELLENRRGVALIHHIGGEHIGGLRESGIPWLPAIPRSWGDVLLRLVAELGSGHTPSRNHPEWWIPEECIIPWVTTGEVSQMRSDQLEYLSQTREKISPIGMANSSAVLHPKDSVVLCRTAASAGYSAIIDEPMAVSQDIAVWRCGPLLRPRFLLLCLRAMRNDLLERLAMGSTHRTIYMPDIEGLRVPLPPLHEQDQIVELVWSIWKLTDKTTSRLQRQIDLLTEHRQALITAAVTGELEIPGAA